MKHRRALTSLLIASALLPGLAPAEFPERPVKLVVASAPGTVADLLARLYAERLRTALNQPVVVDNKAGATGAIAADAVAKAPGDGYTIMLNSSALAINPWIRKQPFNFLQDLTPVARTADTPYIITVNPQKFQNFDQMLAFAKQNPGKLECATYGVGSPPHLALELFKRAAGIYVLHVPYKSSGQAVPELLSGDIGCLVEPPPGAQALLNSGRLRVVAHTGASANNLYPHAEAIGQRFPSATVVGWQAILAPASTPQPVLQRLRTEFAQLLAQPELQNKLREAGFEPSSEGVSDFLKTMEADYQKFGRIIQDAGIRFD